MVGVWVDRVLYLVLAWWRPTGWFVLPVVIGVAAEIGLTLADFVVEDRDRPALGGMAAGERILHTLMAIVYGAMLCRLVPVLVEGAGEPSAMLASRPPAWMSYASTLAAVGTAISDLRDALALWGFDPIWSREPPGQRLGASPSPWPRLYPAGLDHGGQAAAQTHGSRTGVSKLGMSVVGCRAVRGLIRQSPLAVGI